MFVCLKGGLKCRRKFGATYHNAPDTCHFAVFTQFEAETRLASAMRVCTESQLVPLPICYTLRINNYSLLLE